MHPAIALLGHVGQAPLERGDLVVLNQPEFGGDPGRESKQIENQHGRPPGDREHKFSL
jgi:hypothetical protein